MIERWNRGNKMHLEGFETNQIITCQSCFNASILILNITFMHKIFTILCLTSFLIIFNNTVVMGQFQGGGNRNIPCKDSTPVCPCVLPNGDCFDIDTPIDDELKLLVIAGMLIGVYKLYSNRKLQLK